MATGYPPFIFSDPVPASQMMAHAQAVNEGMRIAELGKARQAEGLFRIAQLQQQQKQQQEKNELDRMIAMSQIEQARIGNEFKNRELEQRGSISREGFKADVDVAKIQAGRLDPREAINQERQRYDQELAKKEETQDAILMQEWQTLEGQLQDLTNKKLAPMPNRSWYEWYDRGSDRTAKTQELQRIDPEIARIKQRQANIEAILAQRGKVPSSRPITPSNNPPPTSQLQPPAPADPRIDAIKREAAAAIQAGANPQAVYRRMAELGIDIR